MSRNKKKREDVGIDEGSVRVSEESVGVSEESVGVSEESVGVSEESIVAVRARLRKRNEEGRGSTLFWWWLAFISLILLALTTRLYNVAEPRHVCWDETHFGKMASWYINRTFFFDVHPPLGKMLIALSGHLSGYNGSFPFDKPGDKYYDTPYVGMRLLCTLLGAALVPLSYIIVWQLTLSLTAATLAASCILFDTGMITLTQYILLDPFLLFFILATVCTLLLFLNTSTSYTSSTSQPTSSTSQPTSSTSQTTSSTSQTTSSTSQTTSFTFSWWLWLTLTGVSLTAAMSIKFVGLFVVLLVGITTLCDLWRLLADLSLTMVDLMKHFLARVLCLIILPVCLYVSFFYIHFTVLNKSGSGDGFFSSAFQSQLINNPLYNATMPEYVAYGSIITLKNQRTGGAYLHSHMHLYPDGVGAKQQQVTSYSHKDDNNKWVVRRFEGEGSGKVRGEGSKDEVELVRHGDLITLQHLTTSRNLHSHREHPAPVTRRHYQVTCYGEDGHGDLNDVWQVIVNDHHLIKGQQQQQHNSSESPSTSRSTSSPTSRSVGPPLIQTVRTSFSLVHYLTGCALHSHSKQLPKWGWEQLEVTCYPRGHSPHSNTRWNVEDNWNPNLSNVSFHIFAPTFLSKLLEAHAVMFQGNSGLKPKEGEDTSRPWQWPINIRGQWFSAREQRVYLLGNPVIWWSNLAALPIFLLLYTWDTLLLYRVRPRAATGTGTGTRDQYLYDYKSVVWCSGWWLILSWSIHYLPFYCMGRVLYYHHYFPATLFSSMLTGITLDYMFKQLELTFRSNGVHHFCVGLVLSALTYSFSLFMPLTYGMYDGTHESSALMSDALNSTSLEHSDATSSSSQSQHTAAGDNMYQSLRWLDTWEF